MDQNKNSGDGEPKSASARDQCKLKYTQKGGEVTASELSAESLSASPKSPMEAGNKSSATPTTVFNIGAAPFVCSSSSSTSSSSVHPTAEQSVVVRVNGGTGDNNRPFPWNGIMATSTPINVSNSAAFRNNNNGHLQHHKELPKPRQQQLNGVNGSDGSSTRDKDIMELNNRFNTMCELGRGLQCTPSTSAAMNLQSAGGGGERRAGLLKGGKSIPSTAEVMPGNILRHLNNNNIMGTVLQETNPPPRGASEYRAYFNGNLIKGNNEPQQQQLMAGGVGSMQRALTGQNSLLSSCGLPQSGPLPQINGLLAPPPNGVFYRFDLENNGNRQRGGVQQGGAPIGNNNNPGNQFHHARGVNLGMAPPPLQALQLPLPLPLPPHFGENHFLVSHQNGIIRLQLKDGIEIEMTLDGAVRVANWRCNVSMSLASSSNSAALIHPNGRVLQYHSRVEIMTYDGKNKNSFVRFAKIWYKGISFTSENNALVYLVDSGGTRTTTDSFMDLTNDITEQVFLTGSTHGPAYDNQAKKEVMNHKYWPSLDGTDVHELNGYRIAQTVDGMVRITKANKNILVRTSPGNGSATLTTAYIHCTASLGQTSHLFVRRGERRMHFDGSEFVVRNSGHSAGFDSNNLLRVY